MIVLEILNFFKDKTLLFTGLYHNLKEKEDGSFAFKTHTCPLL